MARRKRNTGSALAGLAAIGALGFMAGKGLYKKPGEKLADLDDRNTGGERKPSDARLQETFMGLDDTGPAGADQGDTGDFLSRRLKVNPETGQAYSMDNLSPMSKASGARPSASSAAAPAAVKSADLSGYDDMYANRQARAAAAPVIGPRSTGRGGYTAQDIRNADGSYEALEKRRLPGRSAATAPGPQRSMTREEMMSQIPGESRAAPQGGQRVSGNEFTRNVGNILNAPVAGFVPVGRAVSAAGRAGSTSRELANLAETPITYLGKSGARPVRGPERLEGAASQAALPGPRGSTASLTRGQKAAEKEQARLALERRKKSEALDESDWTGGAIGYKRGGKIKKMASGGMTSASKRADGIATKGKTRGKLY